MVEEDNLARPATKQEEYFLAILRELREIRALLAGGKKAGKEEKPSLLKKLKRKRK